MPITEPKLKKNIEELLRFAEDPEAVLLDKIDEIKGFLSEFKKLAEELKSLDLSPGADAKPEDVVPLVLEKIKPFLKSGEISGPEIVTKINNLPLVEDQMIDYEHIKNKPKGGNVVTRISKMMIPQYETPIGGTLGTDTVYTFTHEIGQLVLNGQTQDPNIDYSGQGTNRATFLNGITPQPSSLINIYYN